MLVFYLSLIDEEKDKDKFEELYHSYKNQMTYVAMSVVRNETDAEDITIETFSKAFDKLSTYNSDYQFNTWLIAIAKNVHIDLLRKKRTALFVEISEDQDQMVYNIADTDPTAEDVIISQQNLAKLLQDIKKLKPAYQEVIQLRYFQELSYQEIAEKINEPLNNVKIKLLRAKKLLAEIIKRNR